MTFHLWTTDSDGNAVMTDDAEVWARWYETADRRLAETSICRGCSVSTVFLGIDYRFLDDGPPVLWETMVFGGPLDRGQWWYCSRNDALRGHELVVAGARAVLLTWRGLVWRLTWWPLFAGRMLWRRLRIDVAELRKRIQHHD